LFEWGEEREKRFAGSSWSLQVSIGDTMEKDTPMILPAASTTLIYEQ